MQVLLIDACPRPQGISRSRRLGEAFLDALRVQHPQMQLEVLRLDEMQLVPLTGEAEARRSELIAAGRLDENMFAPARSFASAELIVVCAPYWDFAFPASLKTLIEHVCVRTLTFTYENDRPVGLCRAENLVYLTTSGSPIGENNWGGDYLRAVTGQLLGVKRFHQISAEGLDVLGAEPEAILAAAMERARALAATL
ncbi:MAG: NAD(P)H-dependent oxidoreductase [Aristaeellaceae bacterium]